MERGERRHPSPGDDLSIKATTERGDFRGPLETSQFGTTPVLQAENRRDPNDSCWEGREKESIQET